MRAGEMAEKGEKGDEDEELRVVNEEGPSQATRKLYRRHATFRQP